ncbi:hypothetical protein R69919_03910 [Paraburkholderia gardini]|nr:hypothetical protein R69919_03910 [Paraburkholderia gardini]
MIFRRGVLMIKGCLLLTIVLISGSVYAKSTCADIHGQQSYPPLTIANGTICFVQEPVLDPKTSAPIDAKAIYLYYISNGSSPVRAEGRSLLYDDTPGEIVDAFSSRCGRGHHEKVFVIHSFEVRESLVQANSSGKFYSVFVFDPIGNTLRLDERASAWFGADYSWLSDGRRVIYKFPFQSKKDVLQAMDSPFALLMNREKSIPVRVKRKSYLFESPNVMNKTRKYLIEGDRAIVDEAVAGWCHVSYSRGAKPLEMWLMCSAVDINAQVK